MREGFFGLNVALRGLYSAQRNLDIINHNLNNVNTPGYSRQVAEQVASRPIPLSNGTGMLGTGSEVIAVKRVRDEYLDFKYWSEAVTYGEWDAKRIVLADMEAVFNEPSGSGFTTIMNEFFSALQELAKDPASPAVRSLVREKGVTLAKYFNSTAAHLEKLQSDLNNRIYTKVAEINSLGAQIQQLNRQIYIAELDGNTANDLRDQRTLLVDKLSKLINIEANEVVVGKLPNGADDRHFVITISGKAFIDHFDLTKLEAVHRQTKLNPEDVDNLYDIRWEDGNSLDIRGGELKGYLDVRDGNDGLNGSPLYKGIAYYQRKLNEFVRTLAKAFNEGYIDIDGDGVIDDIDGHADGLGLRGSTGIRFFTILGTDDVPLSSAEFINGATGMAQVSERYEAMTAKNFAVSFDIMNDYNTIAAAGPGGEAGNIENLNRLLSLRHNKYMFLEGAPEDFMKSLVTTLGIDSQQAMRICDNQEIVVKQVENRRLSVSGVSIDEELANLVKYQYAYNAAAKMINVMVEVYDTLINRLGL